MATVTSEKYPEASAGVGASARRARWQAGLWWILPTVIGVGAFYPIVGLAVALCWFGALAVAGFRGRKWCDHYCPRGSFHDYVLGRVGKRREMPEAARSWITRLAVLVVLMGVLAYRLPGVWGDWPAVGGVFALLLAVTTLASTILGLRYHQRTWCAVCPAGTMANWIGRNKPPRLELDRAACTDCSLCARVCPLALAPAKTLQATDKHPGDCLKCGVCVEKCPRQALSFIASAEGVDPEARRLAS